MKLRYILLAFGFSSTAFAEVVPQHHYDPSNPKYVVVKPEQLQWQQVPTLPKGAMFVILEGDPKTRGLLPFVKKYHLLLK
jgi:hypothetical protein